MLLGKLGNIAITLACRKDNSVDKTTFTSASEVPLASCTILSDKMKDTMMGDIGVSHVTDPALPLFSFSVPKTEQKTRNNSTDVGLAYEFWT